MNCKKCDELKALFIAEGKEHDVAYRKAMREHADGKHVAPVAAPMPVVTTSAKVK